MFHYHTVEEAIEDIRRGKLVIVTDDENRENEGDFIASAELCSTETMNFMAKYGRGLICLPIDRETAQRLDFPLMVTNNSDPHGTAFTVSIDHVQTGTGISADERALTSRLVADSAAKAEDFRRPGHIFPLVAVDHGVLARPGHTEATVDLMRLAGLSPVGLCCEIMADDGSMMKTPELHTFAKAHGLKFITISDLIHHRLLHETTVSRTTQAQFPTRFGEFIIHGYVDQITGGDHLALTMGDLSLPSPPLARVHSECLTGDALGSCRCDCGEQLAHSMQKIAEEGRGILLYLRQEGRGIGLINKLRAYALQDRGADTVEANLALGFADDLRSYAAAAHIFRDFGLYNLRLMTNNPDKMQQLASLGIATIERIPLRVKSHPAADAYMNTKREKMGHLFD